MKYHMLTATQIVPGRLFAMHITRVAS